MNTSQHALIPPSPKVTLSGLQLASRPNLPNALLSALFPTLDMELRAEAVSSVYSSVLGPRAAACAGGFQAATWSLIFHCHHAREEEIKTNMWWQGVPDMMNRCNQYQTAQRSILLVEAAFDRFSP